MKISQTVKKFAIVFITIFVCVVISFFSFVFVKSLSKDDELDLTKIIPVVHASGGIDGVSYLNSQEGLELFIEKGYKFFEVDFIYTEDGVIVCSHKFDHLENFSYSNRPTYDQFVNGLINGKYHTMTLTYLVAKVKERFKNYF